MAVQLPRRRFTVTEFIQLAERGILAEDDRVELIDGEIIEMAAIGFRHAGCVNRTSRVLIRLLGDSAVVAGQNPVVLGEFYMPQPDIAVLHPRADDYFHGHPTPADVFFLIEISDTTLSYDRKVKLPLYARAGIPEVWIVDLGSNRIERHAEPVDGSYRLVKRMRRGQAITSIALPALTVRVDQIIPE